MIKMKEISETKSMSEVNAFSELNAIPKSENLEWKEKFVERYSKLTDFEKFKEISLSFLRKSIRINTLKKSIEEVRLRLEKKWDLIPVPWCKEGFWIKWKSNNGENSEDRRDIGNTLEHILGYIYVQESASMIPPIVLGPKPGEKILDMCAAPGSKTTQIAQMMKNKVILVANDITGDRLASLGINLMRSGVSNVVVTQMRGQRYRGIEFDKILVDAPCSGTGTIRKSLKTLKMWNPGMVKRLGVIQLRLLENAYTLLKPGGVIVYSTCTLEPDEDEGVISKFLDKYPDMKTEKIKLNIKRGNPVLEFEGEKYNPGVKNCLRIWPQDNDTEGFFVAKLIKQQQN